MGGVLALRSDRDSVVKRKDGFDAASGPSAVETNLRLLSRDAALDVVESHDGLGELMDIFELELAELGLEPSDVISSEGLERLDTVANLLSDLPEVERLRNDDLLTLAASIASVNGGEQRNCQGVAVLPVANITMPGTERLGRDKGVISVVLAPEGSMLPYHFVGRNRHLGLAPSGGPSSEKVLGVRGVLPVLKNGGHQADLIDEGEVYEIEFGRQASFGVQREAWVGVILQPHGSDPRPVSFDCSDSVFSSAH